MPKKRKKITKKEINSTLKSIYRDENGNKLEMKVKKARSKKSDTRRILIGLIVFFALVSAVSWMGVLVFSKFGSGNSDNLKVEILGDKKITAGEEIEYKIRYANKEDTPLARSEIGLYFPKSFVMSESEPVLGDKNKLNLGTLKPGDVGLISIKGKFFATEGTKETIQAVLTYKPSNFNSDFQKVSNFEVEITSSIFDGSLSGPDVSIVGDTLVYEMAYKNKSEEILKGLAVEAVLPDDFIITTTTPQFAKSTRWAINFLEAEAEGKVSVTGRYASGAKGDREVVLKLGILDNGSFLSLIEKNVKTNVVGGDLVANVGINGYNDFGTVRWGSPLNYSIIYKNEGKNTLYDIKLKMKIKALPKENGKSILDWNSLNDPYGGKREGDYIIWTGEEIKGLKKLKPNGEGNIDFSISLIPKPANLAYRDHKIDSVLEMEIARVGDVAVTRMLESNKISTYVSSDTRFISQSRYYDANNSIVGSGPIPPKVGQKTTYKVYWEIENSVHEIEEINASAELPEGVVFENASSDAGEISLDSSLKKVVWSLNRMPTSVKNIKAIFNLSITPNSEDVGKILPLLKNIVFTARDSSTGGKIEISAQNETTALSDDPYVTKGEVEE